MFGLMCEEQQVFLVILSGKYGWKSYFCIYIYFKHF
jgi:hypothetical protein